MNSIQSLPDFYKGKKVLITGNTGFKGSWLSEILLMWGAEVIGLSLPPVTNPNLFSILKHENRVQNYFVDIQNKAAVKEVFEVSKPDIVFHLAAQAIVRESYDKPIETYTTNVIGTANVLDVLRSVVSVKSIVIITTDKVYKNEEWVYPYRETDPLGGYDPYSASKAAADIITTSYIQSFFNPKDFGVKHDKLIAIARAGNVIGGGDWAPYRLVPDLMRSILDKKQKGVIRNPDAIRPWEHVLEPLSGYLLLGQKLYMGEIDVSASWNFGPDSRGFVPVGTVARDIVKILGTGEICIEADATKHEARILKLDINKAQTYLQWSPTLSYEQNIEMTAQWYSSYYQNRVDMIEFTKSQIKDFFNIQ